MVLGGGPRDSGPQNTEGTSQSLGPGAFQEGPWAGWELGVESWAGLPLPGLRHMGQGPRHLRSPEGRAAVLQRLLVRMQREDGSLDHP